MWRKSGTKLQGRYPATYAGDFLGRLGEFVFMAKSNLNLTIWLVQMHSKLASLVRNDIWTCQIVKFALDFAKNTNPSRPSINPPVGVAGSVLIYIFGFLTLLMQLCHQLLDIPHHPNPTKINFYDFIFWKENFVQVHFFWGKKIKIRKPFPDEKCFPSFINAELCKEI